MVAPSIEGPSQDAPDIGSLLWKFQLNPLSDKGWRSVGTRDPEGVNLMNFFIW